MRKLLDLSDRNLVRAIYDLEKVDDENSPELRRFQSLRSDLSRIAWNAFADALECDARPLVKTGVMTFPLNPTIAERFLSVLLASPKTLMRREDFSLGYMQTAPGQCEYMNACNLYRAQTSAAAAVFADFLQEVAPTLAENLGHPFRIASTRQFELVPREIAADKHIDGWPSAICKLFVLPQGAGTHSGTTWFQLRDHKDFTLETGQPTWMIFENSAVWHKPITGASLRPTIEFDIVPASRTFLHPTDAGLAGWYPWFPTETGLLEGTRMALTRTCADGDKSWLDRLHHFVRR